MHLATDGELDQQIVLLLKVMTWSNPTRSLCLSGLTRWCRARATPVRSRQEGQSSTSSGSVDTTARRDVIDAHSTSLGHTLSQFVLRLVVRLSRRIPDADSRRKASQSKLAIPKHPGAISDSRSASMAHLAIVQLTSLMHPQNLSLASLQTSKAHAVHSDSIKCKKSPKSSH